jgi:hypothetical protein
MAGHICEILQTLPSMLNTYGNTLLHKVLRIYFNLVKILFFMSEVTDTFGIGKVSIDLFSCLYYNIFDIDVAWHN